MPQTIHNISRFGLRVSGAASIIIGGSLLTADRVLAQFGSKCNVGSTGGSSSQFRLDQLCVGVSTQGLFASLENVINFVLLIAGVIAFFFVIYGGFIYLTAGGEPDKASKGQKVIINAIIGIVIIFLSLALVRFVTGRTTNQNNAPSFTTP